MRKLHRGARGRVQRAEANLNGMVEAYAARGVKGLRMKRLAGFALLVSLPSNPHPFVAYGGYLKNATGRKILAQFVRQVCYGTVWHAFVSLTSLGGVTHSLLPCLWVGARPKGVHSMCSTW